MRDTVEAAGYVLRADPAGEYDKRLVILTKELGKITVFARGVRRPSSPHLAACEPFVYGVFSLYEGRDAYTLQGIRETVFHEEIRRLYPGVYYGFYFLDLLSFYGQENLEASAMVALLAATLRAMTKEVVPLPLIRRIFEGRLMFVNGDLAEPDPPLQVPAAQYAAAYILKCDLRMLYGFTLSEEAEKEFSAFIDQRIGRITGNRLKSLAVLKKLDI